MFAYTCHFNTFAICNELQNNSMERINRTIVLTVTVVFTIYCLVGYFGYYTYGTNAEDNIITNYPQLSDRSCTEFRINLYFRTTFQERRALSRLPKALQKKTNHNPQFGHRMSVYAIAVSYRTVFTVEFSNFAKY